MTGETLGVSSAAGLVRVPVGEVGVRVTARPWPSVPEAIMASADAEATIEVTRPCRMRFNWTVATDVQPEPTALQIAHPPWTVDVPVGVGSAEVSVPCGPEYVSTSPGPIPTTADPSDFNTNYGEVSVRIVALPTVVVEVVDERGATVPDARVNGAEMDPNQARWRIADPSPTCLLVSQPGGATVRVCPGDPEWRTAGMARVTLPHLAAVALTCDGLQCVTPMAAACVGGAAAGSCDPSGATCVCPTTASGIAGTAGRYGGWTGRIHDGTADLQPGTGALRLAFDVDPSLFECPAMRLLRSDGTDWVGGIAPACEGPGTAVWDGLGPGRYSILTGDGGDWSWIGPIDLGEGEAKTVSAPRPAETVAVDVKPPTADEEWIASVRAGPFWSPPIPLAAPHTSVEAPVGARVLVLGMTRSCTLDVRFAGPATCEPRVGPAPDLVPPP